MATSRYRNNQILENDYLETKNAIKKEDMDAIPVYYIQIRNEDRLDTLAAKYFGDGSYWWVIAEMNNFQWSFDFIPGQIIRIPVNIEDFLKLV